MSNALTDRRPRLAIAAIAAMAAGLLCWRTATGAELMIDRVSDLSFDVHAASETIVFSALGQVWRMPLDGGTATALTPPTLVLERPRISPDGRLVVAEGGDAVSRHSLWLVPLAGGAARELTVAPGRHGDAAWRPDGSAIVFSSDRGRGRDLWSLTLDGVERQLTAAPGDEFDPSWDGDGVLYASDGPGGPAIRRLGPDGVSALLLSRERAVSAPRRRPGGVAIVFVETATDGSRALQLLLPVAERAVKPLVAAGDIADEPIVWRDRDHYVLARGGRLYERELAGPRRRQIPLTAFVSVADPAPRVDVAPELDVEQPLHAAAYPVVLRAPRVFDATSGRHLTNHDVRIESGRIAEVVPRRRWQDVNVLEFADSTILPGLVDTTLRVDAGTGAARLVGGVTTIAVAPEAAEPAHDASDSGPRPNRLPITFADVRGIDGHAARISAIRTARAAGLPVVSDRLLPDLRYGVTELDAAVPGAPGSDAASTDIHRLIRLSGATLRNGTHAATTAFVDWRGSRIADALAPDGGPAPAALAPALGVIARHVAGEPVAPLLRAVTLDAAVAAGRTDIGRIAVGSVADLVIVPGDPIADPRVLLEPIAVVRAGELHSVAGLLERVAARRKTLQTAPSHAREAQGGSYNSLL